MEKTFKTVMVTWLTRRTYLLHRAKLDSDIIVNFQVLQIILCSLWLLPGISWTVSRSSSSSSQLISLSESTLVCSALFFKTCLFASCFSIKWTCNTRYHYSINISLQIPCKSISPKTICVALSQGLDCCNSFWIYSYCQVLHNNLLSRYLMWLLLIMSSDISPCLLSRSRSPR